MASFLEETPEQGEFEGYIGMFDSGVGGLSVLKHARALLPAENFLYFGDSANTPYGSKSPDWIRARCHEIAGRMLDAGCKALVIACNTATSAAADALRASFPDVPVVGIEPALKPAVIENLGGRILVMATPVTVELEKFRKLYAEWAPRATVHVVPCEGLAPRIERGDFDAPDMYDLLTGLIGDYAGRVDSVVLGCTHYPFVKRQIVRVLGENVQVFDGGEGTARHLKRLLEAAGTLREADAEAAGSEGAEGRLVIRSSIDTPESMALYEWMLDQPM